MVAGLLSFPKRHIFPSKTIGINFTLFAKIPGDTLPTKMPAELPSNETIFTETSRLVRLSSLPCRCRKGAEEGGRGGGGSGRTANALRWRCFFGSQFRAQIGSLSPLSVPAIHSRV